MMKVYILILFALNGSFSFDIKVPDNKHISGLDSDIINLTLSGDSYFGDMEFVKVLGQGSFGIVLHMTKKEPHGLDEPVVHHLAIKIGEERYLQDYSDVISEELIEKSTDDLSETVRGVRVTDYLRMLGVPFVTYVHTFRHIVFGRRPIVKSKEELGLETANNLFGIPEEPKKEIEPVGSVVVQAMEYADKGDLYNYTVWLRQSSRKNKAQRKEVILDIWYKVLLIHKMFRDHGILHGDIKEHNIFLVNRADKDDELWPVIGDWDLAFKYDTGSPKPSLTRYTQNFRPPEMEFMTGAHHRLDQGLLGYRYSGKEDIFAIAVMIVSIGKKARISFTSQEKELLSSMAHPLTYDEIKKRAYHRNKVTNAKNQGKDMEKHFSTTYSINRNTINALAKDILDAIVGRNDNYSKYILDRIGPYQEEGNRLNGLFSLLLIRFLNHYDLNDEDQLHFLLNSLYLQEDLDKNKVEQFFFLQAKLPSLNPFEDMLKKRYVPEKALEILRSIMQPSKTLSKHQQEIKREIGELGDYGARLQLDMDENKSKVWVHPTFFDSTPNQIEPHLKKFYKMKAVDDLEYGETIEMPNEKSELYSVYDFCGQVVGHFEDIRKDDESKMDEPFKDWFGERKKKRNLSQINNKGNTDKQVKQIRVI